MKLTRTYKLLTATLLSGIANMSVASTDLVDVYTDALENDTQYKISDADLKSTEQGYRVTRSNLLPQINGSISRSRSDNDNEGQGLDGSPSDPFNSVVDTTSYSLQLDQVLFDWSQWVALDQAEMQVRASELSHGANLQSLMLRSAQAYFNVLSAEEALAISENEKAALKQQLDLTREQYEAGLANSTDFLNAQANYDQAVANVINQETNLVNAQEALRELTGRYYSELDEVGNNVTMVKPSPDNMDDWLRVANESNLGLKAQQMSVRIARDEVKRNRSGHYPRANLRVSYSDQERDTERLFPEGTTGIPALPPGTTTNSSTLSDGYTAGVTVTIPLFSGLRTSAQTEQAKQGYLKATHQLEQNARLVQKNVRSAFSTLKAAIQSFEANKRVLQSSQSSLEATQDGYQAGTRNIIDVLSATRAVYSAERSLSRAKFDYLLSGLQLKQAVGTLTREDIEQVNSWINNN
ncbi:TolC family outer membrane protein [Kangiella sediminilitoris]|uniref:Type I secretion outer membrane protein, TolC family n=1 Tax=Kangiella sediminilitoris TaxID=1144748 RepID=A0A1B3B8Z4_9GAMM|nr:TolC family outer membrane protein [Kangiella sediminilitoris]AOE49274.1 Type I secretion outer membrane protein, TolC family [Kangiella sediminilitoris]